MTTNKITDEQIKQLAQELNREQELSDIAMAIEDLNNGDYYGDKLADSLADIAKSLRVLSGREKI